MRAQKYTAAHWSGRDVVLIVDVDVSRFESSPDRELIRTTRHAWSPLSVVAAEPIGTPLPLCSNDRWKYPIAVLTDAADVQDL
jgi:hypothetical protein